MGDLGAGSAHSSPWREGSDTPVAKLIGASVSSSEKWGVGVPEVGGASEVSFL